LIFAGCGAQPSGTTTSGVTSEPSWWSQTYADGFKTYGTPWDAGDNPEVHVFYFTAGIDQTRPKLRINTRVACWDDVCHSMELRQGWGGSPFWVDPGNYHFGVDGQLDLTGEVTLEKGKAYTVIFYDAPDALKTHFLTDDLFTVAPGRAKLRVMNARMDRAATQVGSEPGDPYCGTCPSTTLVSNLEYGALAEIEYDATLLPFFPQAQGPNRIPAATGDIPGGHGRYIGAYLLSDDSADSDTSRDLSQDFPLIPLPN
jgi:hypothetical protein